MRNLISVISCDKLYTSNRFSARKSCIHTSAYLYRLSSSRVLWSLALIYDDPLINLFLNSVLDRKCRLPRLKTAFPDFPELKARALAVSNTTRKNYDVFGTCQTIEWIGNWENRWIQKIRIAPSDSISKLINTVCNRSLLYTNYILYSLNRKTNFLSY